MLCLETMGMEEVLPAVVVGFEVADDVATDDAALPAPDPAVLSIAQQAGGRSMSYPTVVGAILPLAANVELGERGAADLIRGLRAMAEDPDEVVLEREFPALHAAVLTWGDPYQPEELRRLHARVARGFRLPPFESGIEAFIRCAPADPLTHVRDWRVFSCARRDPADGLASVDDYVLRAERHRLIVDDQRRFDEHLVQVLIATGERLGVTGAPRLFLLWSNSD
jgi:hypothetical protein